MSRTRCAMWDTRASCVTTRIVFPNSWLRRRNRSRTCCPVFVSSSPVGSSARRSGGSFARATPNGDPLLAPAQLIRAVTRTLRHADEIEEFLPACRTNRGALPGQPQWEFDVFLRGERRDEVEELKDETDLRQTIFDEVPVPHVDEVRTVYLDPARGRPVDSSDEIEQRGLPAPRWPLDGHEFAVGHLHVEAAERDHSDFRVRHTLIRSFVRLFGTSATSEFEHPRDVHASDTNRDGKRSQEHGGGPLGVSRSPERGSRTCRAMSRHHSVG